ncbi:MAG: RNA polymerase sigma factor [Ferruginibacter sp.]
MLNNSSLSGQAFEEFYNRFKDFVLILCRKCCSAFDNSNQLADDIFQHTFLKVLHKGYTFQKREVPGKEIYTPEIKSWLSRIAKNELINFLRKNPDEKVLMLQNRIRSQDLEIISHEPDKTDQEPIQSPSIQQDILEKGLSILSEEEKLVLMTYMLYYNRQSPNSHLPDEIIKTLTQKLGVKAGSLRQIKSRALQKIMKIKEQFPIT